MAKVRAKCKLFLHSSLYFVLHLYLLCFSLLLYILLTLQVSEQGVSLHLGVHDNEII